jgi:ABC-type polar amino acid transport system ATPase subunit
MVFQHFKLFPHMTMPDHGKLLEDASPAEFFDVPKDPRAQAFLLQVL